MDSSEYDIPSWIRKIKELTSTKIDPMKGENRSVHWLYSRDKVDTTTLELELADSPCNWLYVTLGDGGVRSAKRSIVRSIRDGWDKRTIGLHGIYINITNSKHVNNLKLYSLFDQLINRNLVTEGCDTIRICHNLHIVVISSTLPSLIMKDTRERCRLVISPGIMKINEIIGDNLIKIDNDKLIRDQKYQLSNRPRKRENVE